MVKFSLVYVPVCCLYFFITDYVSAKNDNEAHHQEWDYTPKHGPKTWDGLCEYGEFQSPINIQLRNAIGTHFGPFSFTRNFFEKYRFKSENNGHTVVVQFIDKSVRPLMFLGGLDGEFFFHHLHMHWGSEHTFEGERAAMELHMVFYNTKYSNIDQAKLQNDGIAVLGVLFDESNETNFYIENFFDYVLNTVRKPFEFPPRPEPENDPPDAPPGAYENGTLVLRNLLPEQIANFFRYFGSLTTPECNEVVQWTVFIRRLPISKKVLESLKLLRDHGMNLLVENFRPVQELSQRHIYVQIKNYGSDNGKNLFSVQLFCCLYLVYSQLM